jgi:hypothetical protein
MQLSRVPSYKISQCNQENLFLNNLRLNSICKKHTIVHHLHSMLAHKLMSLELRLIELLVTANNAGINLIAGGGHILCISGPWKIKFSKKKNRF